MYTLHGPPGEAHWQSACSHTRAPLLCSDHRCQSPTINKLTARSARMTPTRAQCARRWPRTPRATQACACRSDRRRHHMPNSHRFMLLASRAQMAFAANIDFQRQGDNSTRAADAAVIFDAVLAASRLDDIGSFNFATQRPCHPAACRPHHQHWQRV